MQLPFVNRLLKMPTASYFSIPSMKKICQPMFLNWPDTQGIHHQIVHTPTSITLILILRQSSSSSSSFFAHIVSSSHPIPSPNRIYGRVEECPPAD